jgi:hypothetical protein
MPNNTGTLIIAEVRPKSENDIFPVAYSNEIAGGWHSVADISERDSISSPRRREGMVAWVNSESAAYQLVGGVENIHWQLMNIGSVSIPEMSGSITFSEVASVSGYLLSMIHDNDIIIEKLYDDLNSFKSETQIITGYLQSQIDNIIQEGTTVTSSGGSILVTQNGLNYNIEVASVPVQDHNLLNGLQGGNIGEYYHLTESQYASISAARDIIITGGNFINITENSTNNYTIEYFGSQPDIFKTEVASVSGNLQTQINSLTIPTSATFLSDYDSRYVNVTGDTMTGDLSLEGGKLNLTNNTANTILFNTRGVGVPQSGTMSNGTKILLYPASVGYAIGIENRALWQSIPGSLHSFKWYAGTNEIASLDSDGNIILKGLTASQYVKTDANKKLISTSMIPWTDISGAPASLTGDHNDLTERDVAGNHAKLIPVTDSTTALQLCKSDGSGIVVVDTLSPKVSINATTHVYGDLIVEGISGSAGNIVTHDASGKLVDSGVLLSSTITRQFAIINGDGATKTFIVNHNKGTKNIITQVRDNSDTVIGVSIINDTPNTVKIMFNTPPTLSESFTVVIL